ncbi:MAG: energy transducer TonB [Ekhidna sp.]
MKKGLVIVCMIVSTLSLMAIGFVRQQETTIEKKINVEMLTTDVEKVNKTSRDYAGIFDDFALDVSTRFIATISKEDLNKAESISQIIPRDANWGRYSIIETHVRIDNFDLETKVKGTDLVLNDDQLALLKTVEYSDNLQFGAEHSTSRESGSLNYMVSVVPEKQATYADGKDQLISYLKENSSTMITLWKNNQWRGGKINFTIDEQGAVLDVNLISTSGNPTIDQHMKTLITETTNKWSAAENSKGEKVEQVLTFSFGSLGC